MTITNKYNIFVLYSCKMNAIQLELFPVKKQELGYFQREFGWVPKEGEFCRIGRSFAEKLPDMQPKYAMLEEVVVLSLVVDKYLVETTDEYLVKLKGSGFENPKKYQYLVKLEDLCPIFLGEIK